PVRPKHHDLAVEHRMTCLYGMGELLRELRELLEHVPAARDERAVMAFDRGERAEAVVLELEEPVGVVERLLHSNERHRAPRRHHDSECRTDPKCPAMSTSVPGS